MTTTQIPVTYTPIGVKLGPSASIRKSARILRGGYCHAPLSLCQRIPPQAQLPYPFCHYQWQTSGDHRA